MISEALEVALILLACTTPILAIIGLIYFLVSRDNRIKQRSKLQAEQADATIRDLQHEHGELRRRIEVLESIVTDKGYQLDQELRSLGGRARG